MFRNKFIKYSTNPEIMSIYPLVAIMGLTVSLVGYSVYRHLEYDSDYYLMYSKRKNPENKTEFGTKVFEDAGNNQKEEIQWTYNSVKHLKATWPWSVIFNNVKDE
jgi:hypothetical protein